MLERSEELLVGVTILMRALGVSGASIGIENNKPDAIARLSRLAPSYPGIRSFRFGSVIRRGAKTVDRGRYGSGGSAAAGTADRRGGRRLQCFDDGGRVRCGAEEQTFDRAGGDCYGPPDGGSENLLVRFGTPVAVLLEAAGGVPAGDVKVLNGGPMMGRAMSNLASPVVKGCSGITVLGGAAALRGRESSCIKCAKCVSACPMGLEPYLMAKLSRRKLWERLEAEWVTNCIECGCCQFTCPADIPLLDFIRMGKQEVGALIRARAAAHATKK